MRYACPRCGAAYNVTAEHVGRHVVCQQCQTRLIVGPAGFTPMEGPAGASHGASSASAGGYSAAGASGAMEASMNRFDLGSMILTLGAVLVVTFLFMNLLDRARLAYSEAEVRTKESLTMKRIAEAQPPGRTGSADDAARLKKDWDAEKSRLEEGLVNSRLDLAWRGYLYLWGMLAGFALVAVASVMYIATGQTRTRRVTGCILLCAELLLVFVAVVITAAPRFG